MVEQDRGGGTLAAMVSSEIKALVLRFVERLTAQLEDDINGRLRVALGALGPGGSADGARAGRRYEQRSRGRRLQGRYIGLLRRLTGTVRSRVQQAARSEGVEAALALAARLEAE